MSEKSRQFLHGEFVKAGLNVGTAEEFDSLMVNNAESRNWALQQAEKLGFDTTDFERKMTEVTITPTNENVAVSDTTKPTDTPAQILARTKEKATSNNGGKLMAMPVTNLDQWKQEADIKARQAVEDGKASAVMYADNPDLTEAELQQSTSPYTQKFAKQVDRAFGFGKKAFDGNYYKETDPLTGKESYYDVLGNEHMTPLSATQFSNDYIKPIHNQMNAKRDYINSLDQRIADTENKIKEVQAEQAKKTSNANKGASAFMPASARAITETQTAEQLAPQETEELKQLHATLKDLHDMKTTVQAQNELTKSDGFFDWNNAKNIWRGLSDTYTDPYFYSSHLSFGATDLTDAQTKAKVFDKIEKGQELTDTEMQLALASGMADDIKSSADLPIGYTGAKIAGESLPFILQMVFNPATGLAKTAAKAVVRKVGRSGLWAVTARVGARALGATAEAAVLANTIQAGATAADIIDRKTGKVKLGFDENGYLIPTEIDDKKSWGQAIYEGEASKIIENATELMGLPGMGKLTKATAKGLEKLGLKNVRKTINTLSRSKMSQFLERAGWHGPLGEIFEEEAGMFFNIVAQVGDNKWSDFYDIKKQSEIALGCSLFGGVVSVYTTTSAATSLALDAKAERRIKSTDAIAKGRLTESRWLPIKEEFDNALDSEREAMVGRIMSDTSLQPQEKKAMLDYFAAAVYWEGRNQAKAITALESKPTPTQRAINATEEAYQQGMLADNPSDQYDAMEQLRTAEQKVRDFFGWDESVDVDDEIKSYFGTSDQVALLEQLKDYTDDVQDLFADYLFARTKYDGVIEGQAQRVDAGVAELTERLSAESHAARQEMVSATLPDGSACTIIGGNFDIKDGVIDLANSDQTVVIMQDGQKRMISADQVGNVTTMPIEQVINEQVTAYRQQADTEFENGINLVAQSRQQAEATEQQGAQAEQAQEEVPQAEEQTEVVEEEQPTIPVDAKGNPLYEQATPELVVQDIFNNQGLPADIATQFVDNKLEEAKKIAEKLAKKEPKIGTNIAQYKEAMAQWQQATTEAQSNIAFWEEVKAVASQRNQPTEETTPVVEVEEQAEETTEAEQPTEETAKEVTLETEEVAEEQTPVAETQAENTQSVVETQAETTEEQSAEEETPQIEEGQPKEEAPQAEQTEVAEETPTEEQPSAETAEEQPQAEQTEEVTEEYINEVIDKLRDVYESLANEAQTDINNNLESFKAEVASRTDEEIATAIADIESTPDLVELFERVRNGLLSGEIKGTKQEEQDLINALQRIAQGNVAKNTLLPILKEEQRKRAEKPTETAPQQEQEQPELQARLNELKRYTIGELKKAAKNYGIIAQRIPHKQAFYQALQNEANRLIKVFEATKRKNEYGIRIGNKPNTFDSLDKLFQALNKDEDIKALYDKVAKIFKELPIDIIFTDVIGKGPTQGKYSHKGVLTLPGHIVYTEVFPAQKTASIILHEMIHAVTVQAITIAQNEEYFADRGITLTSGMKEAVKILEDIHNRLKHNAIQGEYGATNVKEFVAELSNLKFRAKLKEANLWDKVVSAIKKLFGIDANNALDGSSRALEYLLDNFDSNVWEKYTALIQKLYSAFSPTELMVSSQIDELYPNWLDGTTTDSGKHSTQVEGTRKTYGKVGTWIEENLGKNVAILDASSGMGYGTADLRERGFNIEDVEPYQSEERKQNNPATYSSYADIQKRYDFIISNAVLNVIPDDWRSNVLHDMAERLKTGGRMFINTRKAGEEKDIKDKIELDSPQEVLVKRNGRIASYQRFFTPQELKSWVEQELGEGYTVEIANEKNSGTKGLAAVVVTKTKIEDNQGNPIDENGKLVLQQVPSIDDITDADFNQPTRNVQLPTIPKNVDAAIGANGKPVIIKKNVFKKNAKAHKDVTPRDSRSILKNALYNPNLYGQNQKTSRPHNWILIHLADKNSAVIIEVNETKDNLEVINWHYLNEEALDRKKRQAIREGGLILTLASAAANTPNHLSTDKVNNTSSPTQENDELFRPGDEITMNNVAANLYIESGIYIKELNKLPHLFGSHDGKLNAAQATIENAKKRIEILDEYKAMIVEDMMPNATKPAQEYLQKQVDRINETIDFLNEVIANPEEASHNPKRFTNRFLFRPEEDAADTADTFTSAAEAIAQQLGVEIEIDESIPAKGSYNPRTGRIRINPSRHATAEDVQRTVLHETIGHGGIQAVAGKRFGQVCQQVYDMMSDEQRADIRSRHGNLSDEAVGAEYMAEMAEKGKVDITTWEKVKAMVRNMLMSMGINLNLTDADIRYMLYSAHQLAEKGKLQDAINRATTLGKLRRQAELSHDVAEDAMSRPLMRPIDPDLIELTTGELGLTDVQVIDADTLEKMFDSTKLAKANKHSIFTQFKNNFVDRTRPIAKFIQQVYGLSSIGKAYVWDPEINPHIGANLAPSKAMRRTQVFRKGMMKDLLDTYNNLWMEWRKANRGYGVEYAQAMARLYAIAKTAQERQAIKGKGSKDTDFAGVAGVLKWIGMTVKVHNGKFLKPINWETEASALGKDHDELTIAECEVILAQHGYPSMQEFIDQYEKDVDTSAFWNQTQAISHDMLRNQLEAGLLSPTSYQILMYGKSFVEIAKAKGVTDPNMLISMASMTDSQQLVDLGIITQDEADALTPYYQHYLPLKDSTDIEQTDVVDYGGNRKIEGSKRAVQSVTGHSNMVGDPIARLCYDYTVAIHNEEENKWKLQLLDIVRYHQSTTPPKKRMAVATSRKHINGLIGAFDEVRINPHAMSEHEVAVFENGSQVVIRFADKSIAEAVNPEKVEVGKFLQTLNKANRFLANAYTSKNPAFVVPNVTRDYQAGFQYNLAKGKKQWMVYNKMMANARSRQALYDLLINRENHSAWGNTKYADYVQEFLDNGGPTAVNQMASLDNIQDELNKTAKAINEAKTPLNGLKKGARATTEWLGRIGEMAELTTRLATFIAARECGKSVSLAALEAKEVSVNFDRKGKASIRKYFPLFSIFQNAALQSLRREWGLMREAPLTYAAYRLIKPAMHVGLSIYVGMIINGIDGNDEEEVKEYLLNYFSVNSHTASANFLIPTPWGTSFSIPAAIDDMGFNKLAFLITKRVMLNSITGHAYNAEESVWDDVIEVVSQFADMAGQNPLTVGLSTLTPSFDDMEVGERVVYTLSANPVLSPFIQTYLNRDYKGEKFYGEPIVDQGRPRNYYDWNKNSFGHSVAKLLNDATGGNDAVPGFINIQGAAIDLFLSSYLGGYGDFASKTLDTGKNAGELLFGDGKVEEYGKEKELTVADVISDLPVAYRFAKAPIEVYGEIGVKDHVVRLKNKANEWERQIVNQYKDGFIEEAQEMLQDGNGSGSAQDYYLSIGRSKIYSWSKDIPNAKVLYENMMGETYHNGEYSTIGQAAIIIGQAEMFSSLIKGNFDDLENPNDASYLYEDIKKYYLPTMKEILKEAEPEEANAEIEAIAQEIVDYYNELGNPTPHTKDTKLFKYE